jgi:hypothetical protein
MKLERIHEYVIPVAATLGGMGFAIFCGIISGRGQIGMLSMVISAVVILTLLLMMRASIWIWIPLTWSLGGQIPVLPLPFAARDLVVMAVAGCFLVLKAFKIIRRKPKTTTTDLLLVLMLVYLVTVFVRNPVGVQALGSEKVGGRPYVNVVIACFAYWVLARASLTQWQARFAPLLMAVGQAAEGFLNIFVARFPQTSPVIATFYTGVTTADYEATDVWRSPVGDSSGRQPHLSAIGLPFANLLMAYYRPLTLINPMYVVRFLGFMVVLTLVALSGFRSAMVSVLAYFAIHSYVRRGWGDVIRTAVIGVPLLALVITMHGLLFTLPLSIQRTLSFLPGRWDYVAIAEAKGSSQWRFDMWEQMLFTDKYIDSKWLGDGFGFTRRQFDVMRALSVRTMNTQEVQETYMISGGVHSGPISTIRYVGYVGLVIYLVLLSAIARDAWRLIQRSKSTPIFSLALFIGIPMVWEPLHFVLIFGGYEGSLPLTIYWIGLLKMLHNSLDELKTSVPVKLAPPRPAERLRERTLARTGLHD